MKKISGALEKDSKTLIHQKRGIYYEEENFSCISCCCILYGNVCYCYGGREHSEISAVLTADPTYTVTIPATVNMGNDGTTVDVTASDVENLADGQKISVTIAGTNYYRNQLVLEADRDLVDVNHARTLRYQIISEDGEVIETTGQDTATGSEVVSFTGNETKQYQIKPVIVDANKDRLVTGVPYTGSITFGIELADAE